MVRFLILICLFSFAAHAEKKELPKDLWQTSGVIRVSGSELPTVQSINTQAKAIESSFNDFKDKPNKTNFQTVLENVQKFKVTAAYVEQAADMRKGGALTPLTAASTVTIMSRGIDIAEQFFQFRQQEEATLNRLDLEQPFEDMMHFVEHPLLKIAFAIAIHKVDENSNVDGRTTARDVLRRTFMEILYDVTMFFDTGKNRTSTERYYRPVEVIRREKLIDKLIDVFMPFYLDHVGEMNSEFSKHRDKVYDRDHHEERMAGRALWLSDRMVNTRNERLGSQFYGRALWPILGVTMMALPVFNFMGEAVYSAHGETSFFFFALPAAGLYFLKGLTSSTKSARKWIKVNQKLRSTLDPMLIASSEAHMRKELPLEYHPAVIPGWIEREARYRDRLEEITKVILGYLPKPAKVACERWLGF